MSKIILFITTSLDGYIARKNGGVDWCFTDQDYGYTEFIETVDTVIMGRKTYEQVLTFEDYPYKGMEGYVFSNSLSGQKDDHVTFVSGDVKEFISELQRKEGKNIWLIGGSEVNGEFLRNDLIDEYWVYIHPIILGSGIPLFKESIEPLTLKLRDTHTFDTGLVRLVYCRW